MDTIIQIINFLKVIAALGFAFAIVLNVINLIQCDENQTHTYKKRLKYAIIAFILILCIFPITDLTSKYFDGANIGIGKIPDNISVNPISEIEAKDRLDRDIFTYNREVYVIVYKNQGICLNKPKIWETPVFDMRVKVAKKYNDCQGRTKGNDNNTSASHLIIEINGVNYILEYDKSMFDYIDGRYIVKDKASYNSLKENIHNLPIVNIRSGNFNYENGY